MATWNDLESEEEDYDEEKVNVSLMATIDDPKGSEEQEDKVLSKSESDSDSEEKSLVAQLKHHSWYLDNGCSQHMTSKRAMFQDFELKPV